MLNPENKTLSGRHNIILSCFSEIGQLFSFVVDICLLHDLIEGVINVPKLHCIIDFLDQPYELLRYHVVDPKAQQ